MRDIKFRAWDGLSMQYYFIVARPQSANCLSIMTDEAYAKSKYGQIEWKVMQYTGLKDKSGVEIYEGDILYIRADVFDTNEPGHEVVFGNYCIGEDDYGIEHKTPCFCIKFKDGSGYCGIDDEVVVIGNIYQNPTESEAQNV